MRGFRSRPCLDLLAAILWLCTLSSAFGHDQRAAGGQVPLQLDVSINGHKIGLLGSFVLLGGQRIAATRQELDNLGLRAPPKHGVDPIPLDEILGLTYVYDAARQTINIVASDAHLKPREIGPPAPGLLAISDGRLIGAVINYGLTGTLYDNSGPPPAGPHPFLPSQLQSLNLDTRIFGPFGTFANSGYLGSGIVNEELFVRLESTWSWSDPDMLRSWRLGDVMTRGPLWARSIRLGGGQVQTDFGLRPDLVTAPLPTFRGSAAVPSAVDVFINNTKTFSQEVQPGPFVISNLPTIMGPGSASIVVRDATGRESIQMVSFYSSPILLRRGLLDYSLEAGFVRENYGIVSNDYDVRPVGSASLRYGLTDKVTLESHAEVGAGLVNAGAGTTFSLLNNSLWSLALSASSHEGDVGAQGYVAVQMEFGRATLRLSTQRTLGTYRDLAAVVAPWSGLTASPASGALLLGLEVPKALDVATVSFALPDRASLSLSGINRATEHDVSHILAASYSRPVTGNSSIIASGFHDFETRSSGLFVGLSIPLGDSGHGQVGLTRNGQQVGFAADYAKVASQEPGSIGWRVSDREGDLAARSATVSYQGSVARVEAGVDQAAGGVRGRVTVDGAVVTTSIGTFLANRVNDAFAVVDVGAPDVDVLVENRKVATTNADGRAFIPALKSYQRNKISIDPNKLAADAMAPDVATEAVPRDRGGVAVSLRATRTSGAAIVIFRAPDGTFIPPGASGVVVGTGRSFIVGYDGRAWIEDLAAQNQVKIEMSGEACTGSFAFKQEPGSHAVIDGAICK